MISRSGQNCLLYGGVVLFCFLHSTPAELVSDLGTSGCGTEVGNFYQNFPDNGSSRLWKALEPFSVLCPLGSLEDKNQSYCSPWAIICYKATKHGKEKSSRRVKCLNR